jgi:hypothetical protein
MRTERALPKISLLFVLIVSSWLVALQPDTSHTVTGVVTDNRGSFVANASVAAFPIEEGGSAGNFGWIHVDGKGSFRLVLRTGRYLVRAKDEADGYADPSFLLCSDPNAGFPEISVEQADIADVRVVLGTKGGILEGDLRDKTTQQPVSKGKVTIRDARQHNVFVEVSSNGAGHFEFTVPNKTIQILVTAPGYRATYYQGGAELVLSGGEHRVVTIELTRE